jgi:CspA family cold shock protein
MCKGGLSLTPELGPLLLDGIGSEDSGTPSRATIIGRVAQRVTRYLREKPKRSRRASSAAFCLRSSWSAALLARLHQPTESDVASGIVKWFNATKGYGFIQPDSGGGKDVFVHISAVEKAGLNDLREGAKISYDIISDRGKESAGNLRVQ